MEAQSADMAAIAQAEGATAEAKSSNPDATLPPVAVAVPATEVPADAAPPTPDVFPDPEAIPQADSPAIESDGASSSNDPTNAGETIDQAGQASADAGDEAGDPVGEPVTEDEVLASVLLGNKITEIEKQLEGLTGAERDAKIAELRTGSILQLDWLARRPEGSYVSNGAPGYDTSKGTPMVIQREDKQWQIVRIMSGTGTIGSGTFTCRLRATDGSNTTQDNVVLDRGDVVESFFQSEQNNILPLFDEAQQGALKAYLDSRPGTKADQASPHEKFYDMKKRVQEQTAREYLTTTEAEAEKYGKGFRELGFADVLKKGKSEYGENEATAIAAKEKALGRKLNLDERIGVVRDTLTSHYVAEMDSLEITAGNQIEDMVLKWRSEHKDREGNWPSDEEAMAYRMDKLAKYAIRDEFMKITDKSFMAELRRKTTPKDWAMIVALLSLAIGAHEVEKLLGGR